MSSTAMNTTAMSPAEFEQALRAKGAYYHIHHPFHVAMYQGHASVEQIRGWVANRFYYQINIPLKDAAIMANCPDRETRREWVQRILDHDGAPGEAGGIEAWLRLAEAVGLDREQVLSQELVLPGREKPVQFPGGFTQFSDMECGIRLRPPQLGEHNKEILQDEMGFSLTQLEQMRAARTI